jgi:hypothetical protein
MLFFLTSLQQMKFGDGKFIRLPPKKMLRFQVLGVVWNINISQYSETNVPVQPTDVARTQYTKCRFRNAS